LLKYHSGFDDTEHLAPKQRLAGGKTWRLNEFDNNNDLPLTATAGSMVSIYNMLVFSTAKNHYHFLNLHNNSISGDWEKNLLMMNRN